MVTMGEYSRIGAGFINLFDPDVIIGNYTAIAENVIFCGKMNYPCIVEKNKVANYPFGETFGGDYKVGYSRGSITIGSDVWIGYGVTILDGVTIGDGARVGMKAVVNKDIPPYSVAVGNPIIVKKYRFTPEKIEKLLKIKWWLWGEQIIKERMQDFMDVDLFISKYAKE